MFCFWKDPLLNNSRVFQFAREGISDRAWSDLLLLHNNYFLSDLPHSTATSSHWIKYGRYQRVDIQRDLISVNGLGFGDYENLGKLSTFQKLINMPMVLASRLVLACFPSVYRNATRSVAKSSFRQINPDFVRLTKSLQTISATVPDFGNKKRVAIIGDGFGTFGALLASLYPNTTIVQINLGRQLLFDYLFMVTSHPKREHRILQSLNEIIEGEINYLPAELVSCLDADIEVFISSASFQEMNLETIKDYFCLMRSQSQRTFLYCANRVSKKLPDGELIELEKYGWSLNDTHLSNSSPWWLNLGIKRRPPFIFKMDGRIEERITEIAKL